MVTARLSWYHCMRRALVTQISGGVSSASLRALTVALPTIPPADNAFELQLLKGVVLDCLIQAGQPQATSAYLEGLEAVFGTVNGLRAGRSEKVDPDLDLVLKILRNAESVDETQLSPALLASTAQVPLRRATSAFMSVMGLTLRAYVARRRLLAAHRLIKEQGIKIDAAAKLAGVSKKSLYQKRLLRISSREIIVGARRE